MASVTQQDSFSSSDGHAAHGTTVKMRNQDVIVILQSSKGWSAYKGAQRVFGPSLLAHGLDNFIASYSGAIEQT